MDFFIHFRIRKAQNIVGTFSIIYGWYSFNRLPFGISVDTEVFQKHNTELFKDIKGVFIFLDAILIRTETEEEHN